MRLVNLCRSTIALSQVSPRMDPLVLFKKIKEHGDGADR